MRWLAAIALLLLIAVFLLLMRGGSDLAPGEVTGARRPDASIRERSEQQRDAAVALGAPTPSKQILFGDLHVHTTFSIDAFLYGLPIFTTEGGHPPADACDFARYCSSLDFFSINDHAEGLTPERWRSTIDTLRACDARAGDPTNPDLVPFLGWEWTQVGTTPETHWGHKNVVLRGLGEDEITARPIAFRPRSDEARAPPKIALEVGESVASLVGEPYADFLWWMKRLLAMPPCEAGVVSPDLPSDCLESATTPAELFRKLDEWGRDSLVIPHGLAWGIHAPPAAALDNQLAAEHYDPARQRLLEVFSGHGNSEEFRPWLHRPDALDPNQACPAPTPDHLACCWRAGEIMRERCGDLPEAECEARVVQAQRLALAAGAAPHRVFPDTTVEDWLDCDECRDCFKPAANLRAGMTAQYSLAISNYDGGDEPRRFRWGFIGSSDNHRARSATGYKQWARSKTTDARGLSSPSVDARIQEWTGPERGDPRQPQRVEQNPRSFAALFDKERQASFMFPGGLVAVHAEARDRDAIWRSLQRREVYGTSGSRILLWFDLLNGPRGIAAMGSEVALSARPRFRVRAVGAFEQRPGCPDFAREGLGDERLDALCLGECYHPGDSRIPIAGIEVVRVRPQTASGEAVAERIEDPWRRFDCEPDPSGCVVEFEDESFAALGGDAVYYVRALQTATPAINGANLRTRFDEQGRALRTHPCYGNYRTDADDDCLSPAQERAWSSPIFVDRAE